MEPSKDFKIPELHARMINSCRRRNRRCSKVYSRRTPQPEVLCSYSLLLGQYAEIPEQGSPTKRRKQKRSFTRSGIHPDGLFLYLLYWLGRVHNGESGQESIPWSKIADVLKEEIKVLYVTSRCVGRGLHFPATWQRFPSHAVALEALQPRYICACCLRVGIACS